MDKTLCLLWAFILLRKHENYSVFSTFTERLKCLLQVLIQWLCHLRLIWHRNWPLKMLHFSYCATLYVSVSGKIMYCEKALTLNWNMLTCPMCSKDSKFEKIWKSADNSTKFQIVSSMSVGKMSVGCQLNFLNWHFPTDMDKLGKYSWKSADISTKFQIVSSMSVDKMSVGCQFNFLNWHFTTDMDKLGKYSEKSEDISTKFQIVSSMSVHEMSVGCQLNFLNWHGQIRKILWEIWRFFN